MSSEANYLKKICHYFKHTITFQYIFLGLNHERSKLIINDFCYNFILISKNVEKLMQKHISKMSLIFKELKVNKFMHCLA